MVQLPAELLSTLCDDLHRLPLHQWVVFKLCLLVYKCLHQLAPVYLTSLLTAVIAIATRRHLQSANADDLATPRTRTVGLDPWSFSAAGLSVWYSFPLILLLLLLLLLQTIGGMQQVILQRSQSQQATAPAQTTHRIKAHKRRLTLIVPASAKCSARRSSVTVSGSPRMKTTSLQKESPESPRSIPPTTNTTNAENWKTKHTVNNNTDFWYTSTTQRFIIVTNQATNLPVTPQQLQYKTSNLSIAHVTRDSSGSATSVISVQQ